MFNANGVYLNTMVNVYCLILPLLFADGGGEDANTARNREPTDGAKNFGPIFSESTGTFSNGARLDYRARSEDDKEVNSTDDACNITTMISKSSGVIKSMNYPKPYPTDCQWTYIINVGEGHKLKLLIDHLDLNTEQGDTLTIEPSVSGDKNAKSSSDLISNNSTKSFEVDTECCDSAIIKFIVGNHSNNHTGFTLSFQRNEQSEKEQTENVTGVPGWKQVYLCGMSIYEFNLIQESFKQSLLKSTEEYCDSQSIRQKSNTSSSKNVILNGLVHCPSSWPWSKNCFQLNFSIKIYGSPGELTGDHHADVWRLYRTKGELNKFGIWEYEIPNFEWLFWFWIILLCFISLLFCLFLIIIIKTKLIYYYFKRIKFQEPDEERRRNFTRYYEQSAAFQFFNSENSHRFRFLKDYENISKSTASGSNYGYTGEVFENPACVSQGPNNVVDDFDSEDDQHIYNTLN